MLWVRGDRIGEGLGLLAVEGEADVEVLEGFEFLGDFLLTNLVLIIGHLLYTRLGVTLNPQLYYYLNFAKTLFRQMLFFLQTSPSNYTMSTYSKSSLSTRKYLKR